MSWHGGRVAKGVHKARITFIHFQTVHVAFSYWNLFTFLFPELVIELLQGFSHNEDQYVCAESLVITISWGDGIEPWEAAAEMDQAMWNSSCGGPSCLKWIKSHVWYLSLQKVAGTFNLTLPCSTNMTLIYFNYPSRKFEPWYAMLLQFCNWRKKSKCVGKSKSAAVKSVSSDTSPLQHMDQALEKGCIWR
jgi:hypothetical protein